MGFPTSLSTKHLDLRRVRDEPLNMSRSEKVGRAIVSHPFHNLSGNGQAMTTWDIGVTNRDLGHKSQSDEKLRAKMNSEKPNESQGTLCTHGIVSHSELDVNLRKLVPLEVHDKLGNVKITRKYILKLRWSVPYC